MWWQTEHLSITNPSCSPGAQFRFNPAHWEIVPITTIFTLHWKKWRSRVRHYAKARLASCMLICFTRWCSHRKLWRRGKFLIVGDRGGVAGVLCHSLRSINQKQTPSEKSPPTVISTLQTMYFLLSFRNYKDKENKIPDATPLYLKTAAVQHLHNFNLVPN